MYICTQITTRNTKHMIIRVTIENLYSFKDETAISFVAGKKSTTHAKQVSRAEKRDDIPALKAGIIYGANASGKSNIIKAVNVLQKIALGSVPKLLVEPFKLTRPNNKPSKVEMEFKVGKKFFAYGVEFSIKGIAEEWLYETNARSDKLIFTRKTIVDGNVFNFGNIDGNDETSQLLKFISQSTPINDSFLSEYVKRNGKGLPDVSNVHRWMKDHLKIIFPNTRYIGLLYNAGRSDEQKQATLSLLEYFNTGIVDIRQTKINKDDLELPNDLIDEILCQAKPGSITKVAAKRAPVTYLFETNDDGLTSIYKQKAIHRSEEADEIPFEMNEESDGTIRLLDFIPMLIDLRLNESVYLIDEIDRSMHPMLSQKLLEYYFDHLTDDHDTQLIFTTHESNLLNLDLIRADEVWFVEKGQDGASHLTSLAEYKPREDIRKGYLQGRYGAIPFFATTTNLKW